MFIDLSLCKVFPIQNTLSKAKNTKANFLAFSLEKKKKGVQAVSEAAI